MNNPTPHELAAAREIGNLFLADDISDGDVAELASIIANRRPKPPCNCIDWGATGCLPSCDSNKTMDEYVKELQRKAKALDWLAQQEDTNLTFPQKQLRFTHCSDLTLLEAIEAAMKGKQ